MKSHSKLQLLPLTSLLVSIGCGAEETGKRSIKADVWADNWFAMYAGDELIEEDSVPYNTERSFNKESFEFNTVLPAQLSVIIKDFKENDTGLEYIGTNRQHIGDGGFSAQFTDVETNELLAVSNSDWRCITVHQAPTNSSCVNSSNPESDCQSVIGTEPEGWKNAGFDDSGWPNAVEHTAADVRPLRGYHEVAWPPEARLIWTEDIKTDNTVLCRFTITAPH